MQINNLHIILGISVTTILKKIWLTLIFTPSGIITATHFAEEIQP